MWQTDLMFLLLVILGLVLFLYGANYYSVAVGWTGIGFVIIAVFGYIALKAYEASTKKKK
jgi:membrane-bound ClpP family serine protease